MKAGGTTLYRDLIGLAHLALLACLRPHHHAPSGTGSSKGGSVGTSKGVVMPNVITTASMVLCGPKLPSSHGGRVVTSSVTKLTVGGNPVLTKASIEGKPVDSVDKCQTPLNTATGLKPCLAVQTVAGGLAIKFTVGGQAVVLDMLTGQGITDGVPPGTLVATANQAKLRAA